VLKQRRANYCSIY